MYIKRFAVVVLVLIAAYFLVSISFALWRHDSEVVFNLTISEPENEEGCCCDNVTYTTIQEGIDVLRDEVYNCINNKLENYKDMLEARIVELNNLPFGGITLAELQAECGQYRNVDLVKFGNCINKYADCIDQLSDFYRHSTKAERNAVPDFWTQSNNLWTLHTQLWNKRNVLYGIVNEVWDAGEAKIDYDNDSDGHGGNDDHDGNDGHNGNNGNNGNDGH